MFLFSRGPCLEITPVLPLPAEGNKSFSILICLRTVLVLYLPKDKPIAFSHIPTFLSLLRCACSVKL